MPTITFSTVQSRVNTRVIDLPPAVAAEVPALINDAIHFICACHNFRVMIAEADYATTVGVHSLGSIPSDWKEARENPYYLSNIGWTKEMQWQPTRAYAYRRWAPQDPNQKGPPVDILMGEPLSADQPDPSNPDLDLSALLLEVYPFPDGLSDWPNGEYKIKVPYWRYLPDLSASTDHNWFSDWGDAFLIDFATFRAFQLDWDEARAQFWQKEALGPNWDGFNYNTLGGTARNLINRDKSIGFAPGRVLVPRRDVNAPRDQWRQ